MPLSLSWKAPAMLATVALTSLMILPGTRLASTTWHVKVGAQSPDKEAGLRAPARRLHAALATSVDWRTPCAPERAGRIRPESLMRRRAYLVDKRTNRSLPINSTDTEIHIAGQAPLLDGQADWRVLVAPSIASFATLMWATHG
jgi:hypothetical protein